MKTSSKISNEGAKQKILPQKKENTNKQQISANLKNKMKKIKRTKNLKFKKPIDKLKLIQNQDEKTKKIIMNKINRTSEKKESSSDTMDKSVMCRNNGLEVLDLLKEIKARKVKQNNNDVFKRKKRLNKLKINTQKNNSMNESLLENQNHSLTMRKKKKFFSKLRETLEENKLKKPVASLRTKMMEKLKAARFRFLNEQIYRTTSKETEKIFKTDPEAFKAYHDGYRQQVKSWPINPVTVIVKSIKKLPKFYKIADLGCGDAQIAKSVEQKVYSFDLVAADESVTACDMANVPLEKDSMDVVVFCLSLMGTNLSDYILEANRILKTGGVLKIAEVESRFENVEEFIKKFQKFGFRNIWRDLSHNLFYFLDFTKVHNVKNKNKLPDMSLLPCLYKKR